MCCLCVVSLTDLTSLSSLLLLSAAPSASLLGSPATANSSFDTSFSLNSTLASNTNTPQQPQFAPPTPQHQQQPLQPQPQQSLQQQFPSFQQPPSSFQPSAFGLNIPPAGGQQTYTPAQAQAAQAHIQSFLSKRNLTTNSSLNQSNSLANTFNISDSLNLSLGQSQASYAPSNATLNFSPHIHQSFAAPMPSPVQPPSNAYPAPAAYPSSVANVGGLFSNNLPGSHPNDVSMSGMDDSMVGANALQGGQPFVGIDGQPYDGSNSFRGRPHHDYPSDGDGDGEAQEYVGGRDGLRASQQFQSSIPTSNRARQSVRERMAQVYTEEKNRDLTFKPNIQPLPKGLYNKSGGSSSDHASSAPFLGRVMHWNENKRARERQRAVEVEKKVLEECSFKPKLNHESLSIVEAPGASQRRLFSARSTARAKILELEVRRKEEETFKATCTFEPKLNKNSLNLAATSAMRKPLTAQPNTNTPLGVSSSAKELAECTFAPKINPIKSDMQAAALYLEQDAFERLASSKPKRGHPDENGYSSDGGGSGTARRRSRSAGSSSARRASSQDPLDRSGSASGGKDSQDAQFTEFLARLKYKEFQRSERLSHLRSEEQKQYQYGRPMLSKNSAKIVAKCIEEGRYQSPTKHAAMVAAQRAAGEANQQMLMLHPNSGGNGMEIAAKALASDPECTFTPTINPYSASLSRRSFHEMSQLELIRRSHNLEMAASERLAEEMAEASFTPHLIASTGPGAKASVSQVDSRLKVVSEPDLYVERLEFQRRLRESEIARQRRLREEEEIKECTFTPAVHESPAFVKRIAQSMQVTRLHEMAAAKKVKKGKQDWK